MSQTCAILSCKRSSCALCHCCQQNICLFHLKEHQDLLISELNPLVDQINTLGDRLKAVNMDSKIANARQKLEKWRIECHQKIDHFFSQKCRELDRYITGKMDKQREEVTRIQSKAAELIREEQATRRDLDLLTSTITDLEREVNKIEQKSCNIRSQSLEIDNNWIEIEELGGHRLDLSSLLPVYKTIDCHHGSFVALASNDRFLLVHQNPNLCLVDRTLIIIKKVLWNDDDDIIDICWSSVLDRFIVTTLDDVFFVEQNKLSIEKVLTVKGQNWYSCACSNKSLYLSTNNLGSSIIEYCLLPSMELIRHWKSPDTCQKDEIIDQIRYNNKSLALLITKPHTGAVHIELRASKTLQRLWLLSSDIIDIQKCGFGFCSINEDEWLVSDHEKSRFIHITHDGKLKAMCAYNPVPRCLCMFGPDILVVNTNEGINFHKY